MNNKFENQLTAGYSTYKVTPHYPSDSAKFFENCKKKDCVDCKNILCIIYWNYFTYLTETQILKSTLYVYICAVSNIQQIRCSFSIPVSRLPQRLNQNLTSNWRKKKKDFYLFKKVLRVVARA